MPFFGDAEVMRGRAVNGVTAEPIWLGNVVKGFPRSAIRPQAVVGSSSAVEPRCFAIAPLRSCSSLSALNGVFVPTVQ